MRLIKLLLLSIAFAPLMSNAQITLTTNDFPAAGDTFRVSNAPITSTIDLTLTGANYTWDFSQLTSVSQSVDSFVSVGSTGLIFSLVFGFGTNAADHVQKGPVLPAVPGITIGNPLAFYNNASGNYRQVGYGAELNGIPTPMAFGNNDLIYIFPVAYGNIDSCDSDYGISLTGLGAYQAYQHRLNNVDGWGTVITPYGSFNALRVVSELSGTDSLYLDTLGMGFNIARPLTREYKWLANGEGIPVIQVNTSFLGTVESITSIRYKDSLYTVGMGQVKNQLYHATISPNPSAGEALLKGQFSGSGNIQVLVTELSGKAVGTISISSSELQNGVRIDNNFGELPDGVYLIHLRGNQGTELIRWVHQK